MLFVKYFDTYVQFIFVCFTLHCAHNSFYNFKDKTIKLMPDDYHHIWHDDCPLEIS
jgi:hypothetical protein